MSSTPQQDTDKSTQTFTTALVTNVVIAAVEILAFVVLRQRFKQIYAPRTFRPLLQDRSDPLPSGLFAWFPALIRAPSQDIIPRNGLDSYVFIRFLRLMLLIFTPLFAITWAVLLPVTGANSGGTNTGLSQFTFGNVGTNKQERLAAHIILLYLATFWIFWLLKKEMQHFVEQRHAYLISDSYTRHASSRTVLVTGVPEAYLTDKALRTEFLSYLPGGVRRIWIARNYGDLPDLYDQRLKATSKLESAETKLAKLAAKVKFADAKKAAKSAKSKDVKSHIVVGDEEREDPQGIVPREKRPQHKLGFLGLVGKKVDTIDWAKEEIGRTNEGLREGRAKMDEYKPLTALFVEFEKQIAAHLFTQSLAHHQPLRMSQKFLDIAPEAIHWSTLNLNPFEQKIRFLISWAFTLGLIILWAFPVAFVGIISNISEVCTRVSFLAWLCSLPVPINGIIQGILPPVALAVLFMLLPIVLRLCAVFEGIPTRPLVELSLMTRYFIFLVIHGFLIVTVSSGLTSALPQIIGQPGSVVSILAENLPKASIFFLTYLTVQGLSGAAGGLLRIAALIVFYIKLFILGSTPRSVYGIKFTMAKVAWGTVFPAVTLLTVISLAYSIIAPIINGFAMLTFAFFWLSYKYQFMFVLDQPNDGETGGRFFPKAVHHIFVGLYIEEICLTGLFFLARDENDKVSALPQAILSIILIVITIGFHNILFSGYGPAIDYLPLSLAGQIKDAPAPPTVGGSSSQHTAAANGNGNGEFSDHKRSPSLENEKKHEPSSEIDGAIPDRRSSLAANRNQRHEKESEGGDLALDYKHAFDHPASWKEQRVVWIPDDTLGIGRKEVADCEKKGVKASTGGAWMNEKGTVDVDRSPPDEEWQEPEPEKQTV